MQCYYGDTDSVDVEMQVSSDVIDEIVAGRMTFQKAFMSGDMKMKGISRSCAHWTCCMYSAHRKYKKTVKNGGDFKDEG